MSVFEPNHIHKNGEHEYQHEEFQIDTAFKGLKRKFTVQAGEGISAEMLRISSQDLLQNMRLEHSAEFTEFFEGGLTELQKTITLRLHATDHFLNQLNAATAHVKVKFSLKVLTNKRLNEMSLEEIEHYCVNILANDEC